MVIRMALLHLVATPPSLRNFHTEIDNALHVSKGALSPATKNGGIITTAEALTLPYLQAVVREGLRIYPLTGLVGKQVPVGGDTVHGYKLPEGTVLGQNLWGLCRDKRTWGADADIFRPERWLPGEDVESQARVKEMIGVQELVFGYGKYQCLGKNLAVMELGKVFFEVSLLLFRKQDELVQPWWIISTGVIR